MAKTLEGWGNFTIGVSFYHGVTAPVGKDLIIEA